MNKFANLFMGIAAVAALSACSQDEPMNNGTTDGAGSGEKAYMTVTVSSSGNMSRSTENPRYEDSDKNAAESKVKNAKFFFFDEKGNFVLNAKIINPTGEDPTPDKDKNQNIEWESANVLVLEDVNSKNYPTYMLTVLNMDGFQASETLEKTCQDLSIYAENFNLGAGKDDNFVMTTSSYRRGDKDNFHYTVNKLDNKNFAPTAKAALEATEDGDVQPVVVYVERLAAKVQLNISATPKVVNGKTLYKLEQTVAGDANDDNNPDSTADTDLYLEVLGWTLNGTAIDSYISKQIMDTQDRNWWNTNPFAGWEATSDFRTYWAASRSYDYVKDADTQAERLAYKTISDLKSFQNNFGVGTTTSKALYCYENTNLPKNIVTKTTGDAVSQFQVYNSRVTHVILNTRICDENGNHIDMIKYRGVLFTEEHFIKYVLNDIKNNFDSKLNYYKKDGDKYVQVDVKDVEFEKKDKSFEDVKLVVAKTVTELYRKNAEGKYELIADGVQAFQADLTQYTANNVPSRYKDGANIYFIPIEHNAVSGVEKDDEGYYGVVRNHWYKLDISKFSKVGHGIYNPDDDTTDPIIPEDPEDPLYYLSAKINVLSWRVIKQNVEL